MTWSWYDNLSRRRKIRYKLFIYTDRFTDWLLDTKLGKYDFLFDLVDNSQKFFCAITQHIPERDQCNIPDHDYCVYCGKSTPGQAKRGK